MPKRTPREILEILDYELEGIQVKGTRKGSIDRALKELEEYYTLSDEALRLLLPKKKGLCSNEDFNNLSDNEYALKTERNIGHNLAIDLTFKALQGKIKR